MMPRFAGLALVLAALPTPVSGQPASGRQVFSVGLDAVNVTVAVRDDRGRLVSDLKREDFVIEEDGRPQEVMLFARAFEPGQDETLGLDLGLLFDTSDSMLKELRLSQEAAVRFLDAIPRARELFTIFFAGDIHLSRYDSESQQGLIERIMDATGGGYTALYDAIAVYLSRVQDSPGRKVLVLFTDGEDSDSRLSLPEVLDLVRSSSVVVYPIAFTSHFPAGDARGSLPKAFLQKLAEITGGQVFKPQSSRDLPLIYGKILDELQAQYVLGFASDRPNAGGKFRRLKVEVKGKRLQVRHRAGYLLPRTAPPTN